MAERLEDVPEAKTEIYEQGNHPVKNCSQKRCRGLFFHALSSFVSARTGPVCAIASAPAALP